MPRHYSLTMVGRGAALIAGIFVLACGDNAAVPATEPFPDAASEATESGPSGTVDPSFGQGSGHVSLDGEFARVLEGSSMDALTLQLDGHIIRLTEDGTLDNAFGENGRTPLSSVWPLAPGANGTWIAARSFDGSRAFCFKEWNASFERIDEGNSTFGICVWPSLESKSLGDYDTDSEGRVLVGFAQDLGGYYGRHRPRFARFFPDGTLDTAFGDGGITQLSAGDVDDALVSSVRVLDDGSMVAVLDIAISGDNFTAHSISLVRIEESGVWTTFATFSNASPRRSLIAPALGGGLVLGMHTLRDEGPTGPGSPYPPGGGPEPPPKTWGVAGFEGRGLTPMFDSHGETRTIPIGVERLGAIALQEDGKLLLGIETYEGENFLMRLTDEGLVDHSFAGGVIPVHGDGEWRDLHVLTDGRILAVLQSEDRVHLSRYWP